MHAPRSHGPLFCAESRSPAQARDARSATRLASPARRATCGWSGARTGATTRLTAASASARAATSARGTTQRWHAGRARRTMLTSRLASRGATPTSSTAPRASAEGARSATTSPTRSRPSRARARWPSTCSSRTASRGAKGPVRRSQPSHGPWLRAMHIVPDGRLRHAAQTTAPASPTASASAPRGVPMRRSNPPRCYARVGGLSPAPSLFSSHGPVPAQRLLPALRRVVRDGGRLQRARVQHLRAVRGRRARRPEQVRERARQRHAEEGVQGLLQRALRRRPLRALRLPGVRLLRGLE